MTFKVSGNNIFITRGDTPTLGFNASKYTDLNLTDNRFLFVVKKLSTDPDAKTIFSVEAVFDATTKVVKIPLTSTQTTLNPGKYYWGTKLFVGDDFIQTTNMGEFIIEEGISDVRI